MEAKVCRTMMNIEPTLAALMHQVCRDADKSPSTYLRGLVVQDLHRRKMLTVDMLVRMTSMSTIESVQLLVQES